MRPLSCETGTSLQSELEVSTSGNQQENNPPKPQEHNEWLNDYINSLRYGVICLQQYIIVLRI